MQRLNKYIASSGLCSRRKADELILDKKVKVDGKIVEELGFQVTNRNIVMVEDKVIHPQKNEYYRFYKPSGYITTSSDEKGRKTIYDVIPKELRHLKPIGRLDKDTTGLIIMTTDGDLINKMSHPSIKIPKIYIATINGKITPQEGEKMYNGIEIESDTGEKKTAYAEIFPLEQDNKTSTLRVILYQGINRQIRKMFAKLGYEVLTLKRIQHATVTIEGIKKGQIKPMKPKQVKELMTYISKQEKASND